jgi:hypothetical protein
MSRRVMDKTSPEAHSTRSNAKKDDLTQCVGMPETDHPSENALCRAELYV